jgi:anaerobic ribonucleoside-triphosphate reductase
MERVEISPIDKWATATFKTDETQRRCQFCGYFGGEWVNEGMICPACGKNYDWLLAQDSEE